MARVHGKNTFISVNGKDLSEFCDTSSMETPADVHDLTGYTKNSKVKGGGLLDAKLTFGGKYDSSVTNGPRGVLRPLRGQTDVPWVRRPEGTGTGKPQDSGVGVLSSYVETNPVADYITWSAEIEVSGDIDSTPQA